MSIGTNPKDVFETLVSKLRTDLAVADNLCYLAEDHSKTPPNTDEYCYLVEPGTWQVAQGIFTGAGASGTLVAHQCSIGIHCVNQATDETGRVENFLFRDSNPFGVYDRLGPVMLSLAGSQLPNGTGDLLLTAGLLPAGGDWTKFPKSRNGFAALHFDLMFRWDFGGSCGG